MADNSASKSANDSSDKSTDNSQSMNKSTGARRKVVTSRYMQAKPSHPPKEPAARNQSMNTTLNTTVTARRAVPTPMKKKPTGVAPKKKKASSPIRDNTLNTSLFPADISAIAYAAPTPRHAKKPLQTHQEEMSASSEASGSSSNDTPAPAQPPPAKRTLTRAEQEAMRQEDYLTWCEYMQTIWMNAKLKAAFKQMEEQAMEQITGLYRLVQQKQEELTEKQKIAATIRHTNTLKELDAWYMETFGPTVAELAKLAGVAKSLNCDLTRAERNIKTTDVHDPDDPAYYDSLTRASREMCESFKRTHETVAEELHVAAGIGRSTGQLQETLTLLSDLLTTYKSLRDETESLSLEELQLSADL